VALARACAWVRSSTTATQRSLDTIIGTLRGALPDLRQRYPLASLAVFGSWVRGEQRADSDLDLLVEFDGPIGWQIVTLEDELSARLGIKVDLVPRCGLRPRIGARILAEAVPV
jgi:uncharacterized protein